MTKTKYSQGKNPNSLANLKLGYGGRNKAYGSENKKRRHLTVTDTGWEGAQVFIKQYGCKTVSEFLEKAGRGQLDLRKEELDLSA